ncbi:MAG: glutaminyl-peptide cyclotransferase [Candidatus Sphingomonas phytovorans]|nr:glutaminyl-peptide cyclotransferase [Sphingomonas sp.]WEJ97886.1 MAG: glutaminyl-peptide cyclotransferase [Sphingomonas sp.]
MIRKLACLFLLLAAAPAPPALPVVPAQVVRTLPHDPDAFTEGLFYRDGHLYESTGQVGESSIRKVELETGKVIRSVSIPSPYFGEGIAPVGSQIVSLTWQHHTGFRWTLDGFRKLGSFSYPGEGWALTSNDRTVVMSDGTAQLRFLDPATLKEQRRITVTANGRQIDQLNELEFVDGEILANVWRTQYIVRIDPADGHVIGWIDLSALITAVGETDPEAVPNGIAWDARGRHLYVTGKLWPTLFEIKPPKG